MPDNPCPECAKLRAELAEQRAMFDQAWAEKMAECDRLRAAVDAFQQQADEFNRESPQS